jgi:three-Cys-motif partner protein
VSPPTTTLWPAEEHTLAKHKVLRAYLDAWLPIMSQRNRRLIVIDGFAGPGRYSTGEEGSPQVILRAYLEHDQRVTITSELVCIFIEANRARFNHLTSELQAFQLPPNVKVVPLLGDYGQVFQHALDALGEGQLAPTFAFIDPFGYGDTDLRLTSRILGFRRCEVLVYVPLRFIARFVEVDDAAAAMTTLFGDDQWRATASLAGDARVDALHDLFAAALGQHARYVRSFEMLDTTGNRGYHLFFGTQSEVGLRKMKAAMWEVDPAAGTSFQDSTVRGQLVLFGPRPDFAALLAMLKAKFGHREFAIEEAIRFTLLDTPFRDDGHLKRSTLAPAERSGDLEIVHRVGRAGTYPEGTILRFRPPG